MTKSDYMKILAHNLRRLPKEDFDRALDYFEEYFSEAGPDKEQQAIEDLGAPEDAAKELILNLAVQNANEPPKTLRRGMHAVWIGILAVCAAPVALPLALAAVVVAASAAIVILALVFALWLSYVCAAAVGVLGLIGGVALLFQSTANGIATIGFSISTMGVGLITVYGSALLCKWVFRKLSQSLGRLTKGGKAA